MRKSQVINQQKSHGPIPKFGFKSALIIAGSALLSSIFLPFLLSFTHIDIRLISLLSNAFIISLAVCYCHFYIETDKGFGKNFIQVYIGFFIGISIICYFWLYIGLYM